MKDDQFWEICETEFLVLKSWSWYLAFVNFVFVLFAQEVLQVLEVLKLSPVLNLVYFTDKAYREWSMGFLALGCDVWPSGQRSQGMQNT